MSTRAFSHKIAAMRSAEHKHDSWTTGYRLAHCDGYSVYSREGKLGYVESVLPSPELGDPVALRVRTGHEGERALTLVPTSGVRDVQPWRERVVVDDIPLRLGERDSERSTVAADRKTKSKARRGDLLVVHGHAVGKPERTGEILEVLGEPGHERYRVRWEDEHQSFVYPGSDISIRRAKR